MLAENLKVRRREAVPKLFGLILRPEWFNHERETGSANVLPFFHSARGGLMPWRCGLCSKFALGGQQGPQSTTYIKHPRIPLSLEFQQSTQATSSRSCRLFPSFQQPFYIFPSFFLLPFFLFCSDPSQRTNICTNYFVTDFFPLAIVFLVNTLLELKTHLQLHPPCSTSCLVCSWSSSSASSVLTSNMDVQ